MLEILNISTSIPTLSDIKKTLDNDRIEEAENLLLLYLTHPSTYIKLQKVFGDCVSITKFISVINFSRNIETASCNIRRGEVFIGVDFFKEYLQTHTNLLCILLHERNHYLIRRLKLPYYQNLTASELNILEDAYINGPLFKLLRPNLLYTYYQEEVGLSSILHYESDKLLDWLTSISYPKDKANSLYFKHLKLYSLDSSIPIEQITSYTNWMSEGRDLALWLRENSTDTPSTPIASLGGIGHAKENKTKKLNTILYEGFESTESNVLTKETIKEIEEYIKDIPMGIEEAKAQVSYYLEQGHLGFKAYMSIDQIDVTWLQRTLKGNSYEFKEDGKEIKKQYLTDNIVVDVIDRAHVNKTNCFCLLGELVDLEIDYLDGKTIEIKPVYRR